MKETSQGSPWRPLETEGEPIRTPEQDFLMGRTYCFQSSTASVTERFACSAISGSLKPLSLS